jgi:hypothetical protein
LRFFAKNHIIIVQKVTAEVKTSIQKQVGIRIYRKIAQIVPSKIARIMTYNVAKEALMWAGIYEQNKWLLLLILFIIL